MNIINVTRYAVLISYLSLIVLMLAWHFVLVPDGQLSDTAYLLFFILPLAFPLKGIITGNAYTHAWANFIILIYACHALTVLWVLPEERWLAVIELILVVICFFGCTLYARHQGRAQGLGLKKRKDKEE